MNRPVSTAECLVNDAHSCCLRQRGELLAICCSDPEEAVQVLQPDVCCELQIKDRQPLLTPEDCILAEDIAKADPEVAAMVKEAYGITDLSLLACDPWSGETVSVSLMHSCMRLRSFEHIRHKASRDASGRFGHLLQRGTCGTALPHQAGAMAEPPP